MYWNCSDGGWSLLSILYFIRGHAVRILPYRRIHVYFSYPPYFSKGWALMNDLVHLHPFLFILINAVLAIQIISFSLWAQTFITSLFDPSNSIILVLFIHVLRALVAQWVRQLDYLITHAIVSPMWRGSVTSIVNYKKGALDSQPQVIKLTSCVPMVGGSLCVLWLLPPLKLIAMI